MFKKRTNRLFLVLSMALALFTTACVAPNVMGMASVKIDSSAVPAHLKNRFKVGEVRGDVAGLSLMLLGVAKKSDVKKSFKSALEISLDFAGLSDSRDDSYVISVDLKKSDSSGVFSTKNNIEVTYSVEFPDGAKTFTIKSEATVTMGEYSLGDERALVSIARATEENIDQFLSQLIEQ